MKTTTKTIGTALAIVMTTGLVLQSSHAASKAELAARQQKLNAEALAKMTIKEVAPTAAAIAAMKTVKSKEWTVPTLAMTMKRIPAGTFKMGSPASEKLRHDDEKLHNVTISKPFYMGAYEVTQAQFYKLMLPRLRSCRLDLLPRSVLEGNCNTLSSHGHGPKVFTRRL